VQPLGDEGGFQGGGDARLGGGRVEGRAAVAPVDDEGGQGDGFVGAHADLAGKADRLGGAVQRGLQALDQVGAARTSSFGWASTSRARPSRAATAGASGKRSRAAPAILPAQASASSAEPARWSWATAARAPRPLRAASPICARAWATASSARTTAERSPLAKASWRIASTSSGVKLRLARGAW
jgi:hypothetical protein